MERFSVVIDRVEVEVLHEANPQQGKHAHKVVLTTHGAGPLIRAEAEEFNDLVASKTQIDDLDALIDILVVTVGAIHSLGADAEGAWKEVMRTNFAKIDKETGKVRKREDGKVLKPQGWTPPDLAPHLHKGDPYLQTK
jgi:predicted HAD superfamily Cof-like phosphohydrolase